MHKEKTSQEDNRDERQMKTYKMDAEVQSNVEREFSIQPYSAWRPKECIQPGLFESPQEWG